jgi:hypothetical protein
MKGWPLAAALLVACSSDAVVAPDPTIETPGAFVASTAQGGYGLMRVQAVYHFPQDTVLAVRVYDVLASSWDDARAIAQQQDIAITTASTHILESSVARPYQVVWFRTLEPDEEEANQ